MKLKLPNNTEIDLDINLTYEKKVKIINNILKDYEDYFYKYWDTQRVRTCLDIMGNYLCHKKNINDKEILSRKKFGEMIRGSSKYVPFSCLTTEEQTLLGLIDVIEEDYD